VAWRCASDGRDFSASQADRIAEAAEVTTGEVRARADNQHVQFAYAPGHDRAEEAGVSLRTQRKLDILARLRRAAPETTGRGTLGAAMRQNTAVAALYTLLLTELL
jgi:hypothetical protein